MNSDDDPSHQYHYPQIKYKDKWYVMAPELVNDKMSIKTQLSRCTGCAFYDPKAELSFHCKLQTRDDDRKLENRVGSCDVNDDEDRTPHIYVLRTQWKYYIAQRVSIRMDS